MFKYFVRYQYSTYERKSNDNFSDDYYLTELVYIPNSIIVESECEFTDIGQVQDKLKEVTHSKEYFDIIAINRL